MEFTWSSRPQNKWLTQICEKCNPTKQPVKITEKTYLPPTVSKVTGFSTIHQQREYLQCLAASVNMPYVNITIDVKAALNAFKFLWNELEKYQNAVIHLGDFHFMKENFQVPCLIKNELIINLIFSIS